MKFLMIIAAIACMSVPGKANPPRVVKTYPGIKVPDAETAEEKAWIDRALKCKNISIPYVHRSTLLYFLRVEERYLPRELKGLSLAAACAESGFNPNAMGDYRKWDPVRKMTVKCRRGSSKCYAKAIGAFQFWPWAKKYIDRRDMFSSVEFWAKRVKKQAAVVLRQCRYYPYEYKKAGGRVYTIWSAAEAKAVRGPGKKRCREKTTHWRKWKKWMVDVYRVIGRPVPRPIAPYKSDEDVRPGCKGEPRGPAEAWACRRKVNLWMY